jgi:hypothetical protein
MISICVHKRTLSKTVNNKARGSNEESTNRWKRRIFNAIGASTFNARGT